MTKEKAIRILLWEAVCQMKHDQQLREALHLAIKSLKEVK